MLSEMTVLLANFLQSTIIIISLTAYLPLWLAMVRRRSSEGVAAGAWCMWMASASIALFYAVVQLVLNERGWPLVATSVFNWVMNVVTLYLIYRFRQKRTARIAGPLEAKVTSWRLRIPTCTTPGQCASAHAGSEHR